MPRRTVLLSSLTGLAIGAAGFLSASPAATAGWSAYKTPAAGKWKVQDLFEITAGGSMTIAKGSKKVTALRLNPGPDSVEACGSAPVVLTKAAKIKRVGSYQRPVVGKLSKAGIIEQTSAQVTVNGAPQTAKLEIIFETNGRTAFSARLTAGECDLKFAVRK